jgi:hypothetical protein
VCEGEICYVVEGPGDRDREFFGEFCCEQLAELGAPGLDKGENARGGGSLLSV